MAGGVCSIASCERQEYARGWCNMHWQRWRTHGDPEKTLVPQPARGTISRWLQEVALKWDSDECLFWPFENKVDGYGRVRINGKTQLAHRVVCEAIHGPPPTSRLDCAHSCGRGHHGCVNPKHLRWATRKENVADSIQQGTFSRGEKHPCSKLTEREVREIRRLSGRQSQAQIARRFGVRRESVRSILNGQNWAWLR